MGQINVTGVIYDYSIQYNVLSQQPRSLAPELNPIGSEKTAQVNILKVTNLNLTFERPKPQATLFLTIWLHFLFYKQVLEIFR